MAWRWGGAVGAAATGAVVAAGACAAGAAVVAAGGGAAGFAGALGAGAAGAPVQAAANTSCATSIPSFKGRHIGSSSGRREALPAVVSLRGPVHPAWRRVALSIEDGHARRVARAPG